MRLVLAVLIASLATPALAAGDKYFGSLALTRTQDEYKRAGSSGEDTVTIFNLSAGYVMNPGIVLGAKYFQFEQNSEVGTDDQGQVISGYGPMVGFMHDSGFFANAAYLLWPTKEYEDDVNSNATYYDGDGYVLEGGKIWMFGTWGVGLQLAQSHVTYEKFKDDGVEADLDDEWSDDGLYPYVTALMFF